MMRRLQLIALTLGFILVFLWGYSRVVVPVYSYSGFVFIWPGIERMAWVVALSLIPLSVLPIELRKPSILVLWWLYVSAYIPSLIIPQITLNLPDATALPLQLSVVASMLLLCMVPHMRTLVLPEFTLPKAYFWWGLSVSWAACVGFSLAQISVSRVLANFALLVAGGSEYVIREEFSNQISQTGRVLGYVGRELSEALNPFLIGFGLINQRWWILALGIAGQVLYFGQTGMKEVLFSSILMIFVFILFRRFRKQFASSLLISISVALLFCTSVDLLSHTAIFSTHFTRRAFAGPGLLSGFYFEHYSVVAHTGHSFGGTGSFQRVGPPQEIGFYYFNNGNVDANANFWAEGFAEFGFVGIFGFAAVIGMALWIYDAISLKGRLELAVILATVQADALSNSSPLTILVTHGGILAGVLLYLLPRKQDARQASLQIVWPPRPDSSAKAGNAFPPTVSNEL